MPQKKHKPEEIVAKLRQVDVLLSQGRTVGEAVRSIGVTQFTYYRWRKEFGGLKGDQVKLKTGAAFGLAGGNPKRMETNSIPPLGAAHQWSFVANPDLVGLGQVQLVMLGGNLKRDFPHQALIFRPGDVLLVVIAHSLFSDVAWRDPHDIAGLGDRAPAPITIRTRHRPPTGSDTAASQRYSGTYSIHIPVPWSSVPEALPGYECNASKMSNGAFA
jgi:hypothetical protein